MKKIVIHTLSSLLFILLLLYLFLQVFIIHSHHSSSSLYSYSKEDAKRLKIYVADLEVVDITAEPHVKENLIIKEAYIEKYKGFMHHWYDGADTVSLNNRIINTPYHMIIYFDNDNRYCRDSVLTQQSVKKLGICRAHPEWVDYHKGDTVCYTVHKVENHEEIATIKFVMR